MHTKLRAILIHPERGSVIPLGVTLCFLVVLFTAVVYDGAVYNRAARAAAADAQQAARTGSQALDAGEAITGHPAGVDPGRAIQAATTYLNSRNQTGSVTSTGTTLTVTVTEPFTAPITHFSTTVTGTADAELVRTLGDTPQ